MRFIKISLVTGLIIMFNACSLDLLEDPNSVTIDNARPTLLLNSVQRNVASMFSTLSQAGMQLTRLQNSAGTIYFNVFTPQTFDGTWSTAYAGILYDANAVIEYADKNGWARHAGIARILQAYTLVTLVDCFGNVPYSQALNGLNNLNPKVDDMKDIYAKAMDILDHGKKDLLTQSVPNGGYLNALAETPTDLYYANNYSSWIRLANSIRLKLLLNMRLVDPSAATTGINTLLSDIANGIAGAGLISTQAQNFVFRYGTNLSDPDSRHPLFINNYPSGGGNYMSNHLMWQMYHGYDATHTVGTPTASAQQGDPRIRFYFYRQTNSNSTNPNEIRCVTATSLPAHYPAKVGSAIVYGIAGTPPGISTNPNNAAWSSASGTLSRTFCFPTNVGYWGRDHVNPEGIPPDNNLRTAWGVYPAGGRFDGSSQQAVNATTRGGMYGAGLQPIMMRSFVQFMLAEAALTLNLVGASSPKTYYTNGINYSFTDVRDFAVNGTFGIGNAAATESSSGSNSSTGINDYYTSANYATDVTNYLNGTSGNGFFGALPAYDAALALSKDKALDYIAREYWISLFGNGIEAYNLYRRTHKPSGLQPTISSAPGTFPRSFFYPNNFATLNSTVSQKSDLTQQVFWDSNTSNDIDF